MSAIRKFIGGYKLADRQRIAVRDNGKPYNQARDRNERFRNLVITRVLAAPASASTRLLHDLYTAEAEWVGITNSSGPNLGHLGKLLLEREGPRYVEVYWNGKCQGFEAYLASSEFPPPRDYVALGRRVVREINRLLKGKLSAARRQDLLDARRLFREWATSEDPEHGWNRKSGRKA
jgi:hypothetical protein